jgi:hypothetical protein
MMNSVPSNLFGLDASFAKPLGRLLVLSSLAMALHSAPASQPTSARTLTLTVPTHTQSRLPR